MSAAAAKARLRDIVTRVAVAAQADPAKIPVYLVQGQGEWWIACVDWPLGTDLSLACRVGAYGADAAVDAAARSYAEWAAEKSASWQRKADEARRAHAQWVAIGAAVKERS